VTSASTPSKTCREVMPMPRAASTVFGSTSRTPVYALVKIGGIASAMSAINVGR
jgi:hypothetical protein